MTPSSTSSLTSQESLSTLLETDIDCHVPCWNGLRPGVSTNYDFELFLDGFDEEQLVNLQYTGGCWTRWVDTHTNMLTDVAIDEGNHIGYIAFWPSPETPLTLEDVFGCIGAPDSYSAKVIYGRHGEIGFFLNLIYSELGLIVNSYDWEYEPDDSNFQPLCQVNVSPTLEADVIFFTAPSTISAQVSGTEGPRLPIPVDLRSVEPWSIPGFGTVTLTNFCQEK
jgi:hypothetical protein